jgi:putative addiction module component (TIGR02574 family)
VAHLAEKSYSEIMSEAATEILNSALQLDIRERADIAARLLKSLDGEPEEDVEAAWAEEINRRIERSDQGEGSSRPWEGIRRDLVGR